MVTSANAKTVKKILMVLLVGTECGGIIQTSRRKTEVSFPNGSPRRGRAIDGGTSKYPGFDPDSVGISVPALQKEKSRPGRDAGRLSHATAGPALLRFHRIYKQG